MKFMSTALVATLISLPAMADHLTCSIAKGTDLDIVTFNLADDADTAEGKMSKGVGDLSFFLEVACSTYDCDANITLFSQKSEDEAGSKAFTFDRSFEDSKPVDEPVTGAPDGQAYQLTCNYASDT